MNALSPLDRATDTANSDAATIARAREIVADCRAHLAQLGATAFRRNPDGLAADVLDDIDTQFEGIVDALSVAGTEADCRHNDALLALEAQ